jgi:dCMP deaminase
LASIGSGKLCTFSASVKVGSGRCADREAPRISERASVACVAVGDHQNERFDPDGIVHLASILLFKKLIMCTSRNLSARTNPVIFGQSNIHQLALDAVVLHVMASLPHAKGALRPVIASSVAVEGDPIDSWDEYNLAIAATVSRKSKDPRCRVGAVIVRDHLVLSTGFNGLARDVHDDPVVLNDANEKLKMICHAEENAIYNAARLGVRLQGATIYVTKFPCLGCCNAIVQAGIARIYTHDDRFWDDDQADADHSRKRSLLRQSGIEIDAPYHHAYATKRVVVTKTAPVTQAPANDQADTQEARSTKRVSKRTVSKTEARRKSRKTENERLPLPAVWSVPQASKGDSTK